MTQHRTPRPILASSPQHAASAPAGATSPAPASAPAPSAVPAMSARPPSDLRAASAGAARALRPGTTVLQEPRAVPQAIQPAAPPEAAPVVPRTGVGAAARAEVSELASGAHAGYSALRSTVGDVGLGARAVYGGVSAARRGEGTDETAGSVAGGVATTLEGVATANQGLNHGDLTRTAGIARTASGVLNTAGGVSNMVAGRDAMDRATRAGSASATGGRDEAFLSGLRTTVGGQRDAVGGVRGVVDTAARVMNNGQEVTTETLGAAGRLNQVSRGLRTGGGLLGIATGGIDVVRGVEQAAGDGPSNETLAQNTERVRQGSSRAISGGMSALGGAATLAGATSVLPLTVGAVGVTAASEGNGSAQRLGWMQRNGQGRGGIEMASDFGESVRQRTGSTAAGGAATIAASVPGAVVNMAAYGVENGNRAADATMRAMGIDHGGVEDIEAADRLAHGQRPTDAGRPAGDAHERRVQAAMRRRQAAEAARQRAEAAACPAPQNDPMNVDPTAARPAPRASEVRPGQVDAAGRPTSPGGMHVESLMDAINPDTGLPFASNAERTAWRLRHGIFDLR